MWNLGLCLDWRIYVIDMRTFLSYPSCRYTFRDACDCCKVLSYSKQIMDTVQRLDTAGSIAGSSPWIERAMQADVTPTPCPSLCTSTSPSLVKGAVTDVSCVLSQTFDVQSCHSSDIQRSEKSMRSAFHSDQHHESTVDTDLCTDDDDLETTPVDEKRKKRFVSFLPVSWWFGVAVLEGIRLEVCPSQSKKLLTVFGMVSRMLSNRASAQRSRQRRQERLDQLEVLVSVAFLQWQIFSPMSYLHWALELSSFDEFCWGQAFPLLPSSLYVVTKLNAWNDWYCS